MQKFTEIVIAIFQKLPFLNKNDLSLSSMELGVLIWDFR
jgi:hypothetical protein